MNNVNLIGRLARDWREIDKGDNYLAFNSIAVNRQKDVTDFIPICATGDAGKAAVKFTKKGEKIGVIGTLITYIKEKDKVKYTDFYVSTKNIEFLEAKPKEEKPATTEGIPFEL